MISTPMYNGSGLGNQLANYVTVKCLALDKGYSFGVMYPERFKGHSFMNLDMGIKVEDADIPVEGQTPKTLPKPLKHYYREEMVENGDYDQNLKGIEDNTLIHGNLQGVEYFKHRKNEVREWLKVEQLEMPDDLCIINFRGGEYKWVSDFFLPHRYWRQAMDNMLLINPKMRFEVHTDDTETAREFFPNLKITQDIGLNWRSIRYAKYLILSNSSFAILPAYLNEDVKKVIAPWGFGRFNTGKWLLKQNYVEEWDWIKNE